MGDRKHTQTHLAPASNPLSISLSLSLDYPQIEGDPAPAIASVGLWTEHKFPPPSVCYPWPRRLARAPIGTLARHQASVAGHSRHGPGFLQSLQALAPQADNGELALSREEVPEGAGMDPESKT